MDSDRILVMDEGKVAEFDTPANLLARDSHFSKLVESMNLTPSRKPFYKCKGKGSAFYGSVDTDAVSISITPKNKKPKVTAGSAVDGGAAGGAARYVAGKRRIANC
ncbi:hypothetical protein GGI19_003280 [Coemansia pectinata]|uniref:Uncharacterized protein n=1 Tax=Coemansia pectinata TaxID=1052879 RepID=A0A9W8LB40_9FUNG|nr:hypothetical protein GGI19_003280 [Coemansia pectinata]